MADKEKKGKRAKEKDEKPKVSVQELLAKLEKSDDPTEKRNLRAQLRSRGHTGGLNKEKTPPKKKGKKEKATAE